MLLTLKTLSPVHIGTGNLLEPFDFYIENQNIYILNHDYCMKALFENDPENITRFSNWVDEMAEKIAKADKEVKEARRNRNRKLSTDKNQLIANLRKDFNIVDFTRNILKKPTLADQFINTPSFYKYRAFIPNRPRSVVQLKEIIKTNGMPYIPGSSIKGSIRTALAFAIIRQMDGSEADKFLQYKDKSGESLLEIINKLKDASKKVLQTIQHGPPERQKEAFKQLSFLTNRYDKSIGQQVEKFVFGCDDGKGKIGDPKYDLMRLIKVSDTKASDASMLVAEMKSFTRDGRSGDIKSQPINLAEFIDSDSQFEFSLEVDVKLIKFLFARSNHREWHGFESKMASLFSLNAESVNIMDETVLEQHIIKKIMEAVHDLGQVIIAKEKTWLDRFNLKDRQELDTLLGQIAANEQATKLGFASGWFATTIGLALQHNQYLENILPDIIFAFNLDLIIKDERLLKYPAKDRRNAERQQRLLQRSPDSKAFPGSRRLIADRYVPSEYIGWIKIIEGQLKAKSTESKAKEHIKQSENNMDDAIKALKDHFK